MKISKILKNEWVIGLLLLGIFLVTNGYIYGWDDQHVEIPLFKKLIDPTLYPNDYYVDALKVNFMSYVYPLLAKVITIKQIPTAYFILYLLSRYFLFFFMYKIWHTISKHRGIAFFSVLMIMLLGRVEEFLYRTFSHQEFALAFIFAGIYLFYKERFTLSAVILGLTANFHALYSLFPMCYLGLYLLLKKDWRQLLKSCAGFIIMALPFLIWAGKKYLFSRAGSAPPASEWIGLYQLACPQNFLFLDSRISHVFENFKNFWDGTGLYWFMALMCFFHILFTKKFQEDKKIHAVLIAGWIMLIVSFIFSYVFPMRFVLDLNLIRNSQYMLFFLMGYLIIFLYELSKHNKWKFFSCLLILPLIRFGYYDGFLALVLMAFIQYLDDRKPSTKKQYAYLTATILFICAAIGLIIKSFFTHKYSASTIITFGITELLIIISVILYVITGKKHNQSIILTALAIPFILLTVNFVIYHAQFLNIQKNGLGFWQLQRNWIDMQNYVRKNTPKDALLLVPHDMEMGGFRIRSERSIVMSYRDCGVIGFDYQAGKEWKKRLDEIGAFQVIIKEPPERAIFTALAKYKVDYIVFMNYYKFPKIPMLTKIYQNEAFNLYKVNR